MQYEVSQQWRVGGCAIRGRGLVGYSLAFPGWCFGFWVLGSRHRSMVREANHLLYYDIISTQI